MSVVRLPLPAIVGNNGSYGFVRRTPADGGCGVGSYPCTHRGVDLVAPDGTRVVSPVSGWVRYSVGAIPPFKGFDPHIVVIEEDNPDEEYRFHLIGHLDYYRSRGYFGDNHSGGWPTKIGTRVTAGQVIGVVGGYHHIHWQNQKQAYQSNGQTWATMTQDPLAWARRRGAIYVAPSINVADFAPAAVVVAGLALLKKG